MRLVELQIKNYYCIGNQGVNVRIDDIVVLIGANNVGKTTVLKAYEQFKQGGGGIPLDAFFQSKADEAVEICGVFSDINDEDKSKIGSKWIYSDEIYGDVIKYKWVWSVPNENGQKFSWNEEESNWDQGGMGGWDSKISSCIPTPIKISPLDSSETLESKIIEILSSAVKQTIKEDESKLKSMVEEINKLAEEVKDEISTTLTDTISRLESNLHDIFPNHSINIQPYAGKIDADKIIASGSHIRVTDQLGVSFPLSNQGSGLQRAFLWSAIEALSNSGNLRVGRNTVSNEQPRILLIEEPESFLHPPAIRAAREALYRIAELANWQVMITTHSPIFIDVSKSHTTIIRVDKSSSTGTKTFSTDKATFDEDERKRLQMIRACHPTINEFFFCDNIILVEGETESAVLNSRKSAGANTIVVNCFGKGNIPMFQKILNQFQCNYLVMHDSDSPKCKRDGKWIGNPMWSINSKIIETAKMMDGNKVIVNIPDFEGQYFGYLQKGDKPYNAIIEVNKEDFIKSNKFIELDNIANNNVADDFKCRISAETDYTTYVEEYKADNGIGDDQWSFD